VADRKMSIAQRAVLKIYYNARGKIGGLRRNI
jgi:hypothetical protein